MSRGAFGAEVAATYDADVAERFDPSTLAATTEVLADLAGDGVALEFAIGTGRVALPLAARGVEVHGLELSEPMVAKLREKPGGDVIPVTMGDMATTRVDGDFTLVFLVFNTINNLTDQERQVACFRNAAAHLVVGGHFVVEVGVPSLQRLPVGETLVPFDVSDEHLGVDEYDVVAQRLTSHHVYVRGDRVDRWSGEFRYVWPAELDLMARLAGLTFVSRWSDFRRRPFTATSTAHVSIWRKDAT